MAKVVAYGRDDTAYSGNWLVGPRFRFFAKQGRAYAIIWAASTLCAATGAGDFQVMILSDELGRSGVTDAPHLSNFGNTTSRIIDYSERVAKDTTDVFSHLSATVVTPRSPGWQQFVMSAGFPGTAGTLRWCRYLVLELEPGLDEYVQDRALSTTTSTTFQDKVSLNFTPPSSGDYLFMAFARVGHTAGTANLVGVQLNDQSTVYGLAEPMRSQAAGLEMPWWTFVRKTGLSAAQDWDLEWRTSSGSSTSSIQYALVLALRLDALPGTFDYAEQLARTTTTTNWPSGTTRVTLVPTVTVAGDYAVLWTGNLDSSSATASVGAGLFENGSGVEPDAFQEPTGTTEEMPLGGLDIRTLTTTEPTYTLQFGDEASNTAGIKDAAIALIQLSPEAQGIVAWAEMELPAAPVGGDTFDESFSLSAGVAAVFAAALTREGAVSLSTGHGVTPAVQIDFNPGVTLSTGQAAALAVTADLQAAMTLGTGQAAGFTGALDIFPALSLGVGLAAALVGGLSLEAAVSFGVGTAAAFARTADVPVSTSFGISAALTPAAQVDFNPGLALPAGLAVSFVPGVDIPRSFSLGAGVAAAFLSGIQFEAAVSLGLAAAAAFTRAVDIPAGLSLSMGAGVTPAPQVAFAPAVTLGIGAGTLLEAFNSISAGFTLSTGQAVTFLVTGQDFAESITLGAGFAAAVAAAVDFQPTLSLGVATTIGLAPVVVMQAAFVLPAGLAALVTGGLVVDKALALGAAMGLNLDRAAEINPSVTLGFQAGVTESATVIGAVAFTLPVALAQALHAQLVIDQSLLIEIDLGIAFDLRDAIVPGHIVLSSEAVAVAMGGATIVALLAVADEPAAVIKGEIEEA